MWIYSELAVMLRWGMIWHMTDAIPDPQSTQSVFAGREKIFSRIQQTILDPPAKHALLFTGHDGIGKTALLQQAQHVFSDPILCVFIALTEDMTESDILEQLIDATNFMLSEHEFSLARVPEIADDSPLSSRDWMRDVYLSTVITIIRPHRHLVWLIDDAHLVLNNAPEFLLYMDSLLADYPQLTIILSASTDYDNRLQEFAPLIDPTAAERIRRLTHDESAILLRQLAPGASEAAIEKVCTLTGGHPQLLQAYGKAMNADFTHSSDVTDVQKVTPRVYTSVKDLFRDAWGHLNRNERLTLTAIASLLYDDPLKSVSSQNLATWLVQNDYPMDIVGVHAALRGLDYRDIVAHQEDGSIKLLAGLMQSWLLENALLDEDNNQSIFQLRWWMLALAILIIVILLILATQAPQLVNPLPEAAPTITLSP